MNKFYLFIFSIIYKKRESENGFNNDLIGFRCNRECDCVKTNKVNVKTRITINHKNEQFVRDICEAKFKACNLSKAYKRQSDGTNNH